VWDFKVKLRLVHAIENLRVVVNKTIKILPQRKGGIVFFSPARVSFDAGTNFALFCSRRSARAALLSVSKKGKKGKKYIVSRQS